MKIKNILIPIIIALLIIAGIVTFFLANEYKEPVLYGPYEVVRVVDGDTIIIELNGKEERIRFIGIDAPESVHPDDGQNIPYGQISSDYTKSMLENKTVQIELDVEEHDQYGRLLAYVYIDGTMINKSMLKEGHAKVTTYPPNVKYVEDFNALQKRARYEARGLWAYEY